MWRAGYFGIGTLLIVSAVHLGHRLVVDRDFVVLAAVSPAILAAAAFGALLLARVFRKS